MDSDPYKGLGAGKKPGVKPRLAAWPEPGFSTFLPLRPTGHSWVRWPNGGRASRCSVGVRLWMMDSPQQLAGTLPLDGGALGGNPSGKSQAGGGEGKFEWAQRDRPVTTIWAFARPVPALLAATHSYVPSSALEARGISQLLFPDCLQTQSSRGHAMTQTPVRDPQPPPALRGLGP